MDELLKSLDGMKEMQIVRFFARFFTEERLSPLFNQYKERVLGDPGGLAGELILWAVLLAVGVFLIDQAFHWTAPGQLEQARLTWFRVREGTGRAYDRTKEFILNTIDRLRSGGSGRGRR